MPMIHLEAINAELAASFGEFERNLPLLSFRVKLAHGESIKLSSNENFEDLEGHVTIFPIYNESPNKEKDFGTLHYFSAREDDFFPTSPSFIVEVGVSAIHFYELLSAAKFGRAPSKISVEVENMEYDWQPDGSGKKWDNQSSPRLPVNSIRFNVPLISLSDTDSTERCRSDNLMPATVLQADQLMQHLDIDDIQIAKTLRHIFWAILILGGMMISSRW